MNSRAPVLSLQAKQEEPSAQVEEIRARALETDALRTQLAQAQAEIQDLSGYVSKLKTQLSYSHNGRGRAERQLATAYEKLRDAERRLKQETAESTELRAYLWDNNCMWGADFRRWQQERYKCFEPRGCSPQRSATLLSSHAVP